MVRYLPKGKTINQIGRRYRMSKMPMKNSHRMFLQSFMSRAILLPRDVRKLHRLCCERFTEQYSEEGLVEFVSVINTNIKPIHLEIRKAITEDTGAHCYVLVNTRESDILLSSSDYSANELEFFKKMIENIVESDSGTLAASDALNLSDRLERKIGKKEAQDLLGRFVQDQWLSKNAQGCYSLSARSILELEQYMLEQYPDSTVKCNMCKRICLQGQACTSCDVKLHTHCAIRLFDKKAVKTCPGAGCDTPWPHDITPRPKEVTGEPASQSAGTSQPSGRKRRATRTS